MRADGPAPRRPGRGRPREHRCRSLLLALGALLLVPLAPAGSANAAVRSDAPLITITAPPGAHEGWYADTVEVTVRVQAQEGNRIAEASYLLGGATQGTGPILTASGTTLRISAEGSTRLDVQAVALNDVSSSATWWIGVDRTSPSVAFDPGLSDGMEVPVGAVVPVGYTCTDGHSGVGSCTGSVPSGGRLDTATEGTREILVTAVDNVGNTRESRLRVEVRPATITASGRPTILGTPRVGETLRARAPAFSVTPDRLSYRWYRAGTALTGATDIAYSPTADDVGSGLSVQVTAHKAGFVDGSGFSVSTATVTSGSLAGGPPVLVHGLHAVGKELRVEHGDTVPGAAAVGYRWFRGPMPITGATAARYRLTAEDAGHPVGVMVIWQRPGYQAREVSSDQAVVGYGTLRLVGTARITGTAQVGRRLSALAPGLTPRAEQLWYQWLRNGHPIAGATGPTYTVSSTDLRARLGVQVRAERSGYLALASTSPPTPAVRPARARLTVRASSPAARRVLVRVRVTASGLRPGGKVSLRLGGKRLARAAVSPRGTAILRVGRQRPGRHRYQVRYTGSPGVLAATVRTPEVRVR